MVRIQYRETGANNSEYLKAFYGFLKENLKEDLGKENYRALFKNARTYWGYPMAVGS